MMKRIIYLLICVMIVSCTQEEFNIGNFNDPDGERVLRNAADFRNFNIANHTAVMKGQVDFSGIYFRGLSDQFSTTNAFSGFWDFCDQPRRQIINSTSNDDLSGQAGGGWNDFNAVINKANLVIDNIENKGGGVVIDEVDLTQQELSAAYFDKGISQGYLSMIYDKAYIVNPDTDTATLAFSTYQEVLTAAVDNIKRAIELATSNDFEYSVYAIATPIDRSTFIQLANSYIARFLIAMPRTNAEAQSVDYNTVLSYANNGITSNFDPAAEETVFFNNFQEWSLFSLGDGSGYMPTDIKIQRLFDPTYDTDYPVDESIILGEAVSDDPRLNDYYEYVGENFGFLRASRGRYLFTSYRTKKFYNDNDQNQTGIPVNIFPKAEIDYIKAECYYRLNDMPGAVAALDASPRMTVGNQSTTAAGANVLNALLYEVSIELDLASGMCIEWAFMRRHDMLQAGSPTMFPVPASELEITQDDIYTFGGPSAAGEVGTASGSNDWKNINLVY